MSLLCKTFGHKTITKTEYYPHILADIVTEYIYTLECKRCGLVHITHKEWDSKKQNFVDKI